MDTDTVVLVAVLLARLGIPLLIPRYPLPAILAALVIDAADQSIFQLATDRDLEGYQVYDKALDIYYLTIAYLAVLRNWTNGFAADVARFLWYYRLVGVVLFELFEERALLFVFPNTFEYFFIAYEVVRLGWDPRRLSRRQVLWMAGTIWVVIKLPQEWWIHIAQNDVTDLVRERVFGVDVDASWGTAFANRPLALVAILAGMAVIAVVLVAIVRRLPPRDWSLRVSADAPVPAIELPQADTATGPQLRRPNLEKIVLITLVGMIFGQLLQVRASNLQVLGAAALVVAVDAGVSALLGRRGLDARWIALQVVVLTAVNVAVLGAFATVVVDGRINRGATVFFGVLLALIISLYDRCRAIRLQRMATGPRVVAS